MEQTSEQQDTQQHGQASRTRHSRIVWWIASIVLLVLVLFGAAFIYVQMSSHEGHQAQSNKESATSSGSTTASSAPSSVTNRTESSASPQKSVVITLGRSNLSREVGGLDVPWGGEMRHMKARPLDIFTDISIKNNLEEPVSLTGIINEHTKDIELDPEGHATPLYVLPELFYSSDGSTYHCEGRDIFKKQYSHQVLKDTIDNRCSFAKPLVIGPGEHIELHPNLFASASHKAPHFSADTRFRSSEESTSTEAFIHTLTARDKTFWFLSSRFSDYDSVSETSTFNIGGIIVGNADDKQQLLSLFQFKKSKPVFLKVEKSDLVVKNLAPHQYVVDTDQRTARVPLENAPGQSATLEYDTYSLSQEIKNEYANARVGVQVFLYRNGLLQHEQITGRHNAATAQAIEQVQQKSGLVQTGQLDASTAALGLLHESYDTGQWRYEGPYGPGNLVLSYGEQFQLLGREHGTFRKASTTLEVSSVKGEHNAAYHIIDNGVMKDTTKFEDIFLVNTNADTTTCTLTDGNGRRLFSETMARNELIRFRRSYAHRTLDLVQLECGNATLDLENVLDIETGRG